MKLTGRVSLEELDAYAHYMGFDSWASYKLTLSDYEINLLIIAIYETRKEQPNVNLRTTKPLWGRYH